MEEHERLYGNGADISMVPDLNPAHKADFYKTKESIRVISMSLPIPEPYEYEQRRMLSTTAAPPSAQNISQEDGSTPPWDTRNKFVESVRKMLAERTVDTTASPRGARPRNE
ncbi:unnamed protein product [Gongylonema pulchrum]|uniref:Uncharacterized protein n=1 Tax=Gongylonema pulchrum TaxID=637853 RepID=A0A3P6Q1E6_9BILA|nr:unnamed protein product [Gongylonema pulchrum]